MSGIFVASWNTAYCSTLNCYVQKSRLILCMYRTYYYTSYNFVLTVLLLFIELPYQGLNYFIHNCA
jgi:hypothetical protein